MKKINTADDVQKKRMKVTSKRNVYRNVCMTLQIEWKRSREREWEGSEGMFCSVQKKGMILMGTSFKEGIKGKAGLL